jgi:hypothetical protein
MFDFDTSSDLPAAPDPRFNTRPSVPRPGDAQVFTARRVVMLRLSRLPSGEVMPSGEGIYASDLVEELQDEGFEEAAILWAIHELRAGEQLRLSWHKHWVQGTCREGRWLQPWTYTLPCCVDLSGERPRVFGDEKAPLSEKTRFVIQLLHDAFPDGLTTKELRDKCGGDPVGLLKRLRAKDSDWEHAILTPGRAYQDGKYRLAPDQQAV